MDFFKTLSDRFSIAWLPVLGLALLAVFAAMGLVGTLAGSVFALLLLAGAAAAASVKRGPVVEAPVVKVDTSLAAAILDALPAPVLLLGEGRRVVAANLAALEVLGEGIKGRDLSLFLRNPEVIEATNGVLAGEPRRHIVISMPLPVLRYFDVQMAPLPFTGGDSARAVMAMHDITAVKGAEQIRADFVANVSHELRSPLSSVSGFIETLRGPAKDDAAARERFLGIMDGEARRMTRLIDDLLSLAQVEANEHLAPKGAVDLEALAGELMESLSVQAKERKMTIRIAVAKGLPPAKGEERQIYEVFQNLVVNAIKYGAEGSEINIALAAVTRIPTMGGAGVSFAVSNRGEGIAPEHLPRLTERFYRVDKGRSRAMGGTGLGLAIVKHIVNRHRGYLAVESKKGQGSTFTVFLPVV